MRSNACWTSSTIAAAARRTRCAAARFLRAAAPLGVKPRDASMKRLALILLVAVAGCGSDASPQSENYGNILASPEGLVLVESEHPTGWTRPDCFVCHNVNNIHQVNRTGLPDDEADLKNVRTIVRNQGEASCPMCHGDNGAAQ